MPTPRVNHQCKPHDFIMFSPLLQALPAPLQRIAALSLITATLGLVASPSRAIGFTSGFQPTNWTLINHTAAGSDQSLSGDAAICAFINTVACLEGLDAVAGAVDLVGSSAANNPAGGGLANTSRSSSWQVTNAGPDLAVISFDWFFETWNQSNQTASYFINDQETVLGASTSTSSSAISGIELGAGDTFGFRVSTTDNLGTEAVLSINGFSAEPVPVPAPLPLAGGLAGCCWLRRLRSRVVRRALAAA